MSSNKQCKEKGNCGKRWAGCWTEARAAGLEQRGGLRPPQPRNSAATMGGLGACPRLCGGRAGFGVFISVVNTF